jgi:hypothetical protein
MYAEEAEHLDPSNPCSRAYNSRPPTPFSTSFPPKMRNIIPQGDEICKKWKWKNCNLPKNPFD